MASWDSLFFRPTRVPPTTVDSKSVQLSFPAHASPDDEAKQTHGFVAVVTLDNAAVLNALTRDEIMLLIATLQWIGEQPEILVVVLTGRGRFFSAGANFNQSARSAARPPILDELDREDPRHVLERRKYNLQLIATTQSMLCRTLVGLDKLVVGALNGPVVGISAVMVSYCDLIYTHDDFWLATPFSSLALVAEGGSTLSFSRKMGMGRAQQALLEGRKMPAKELLEAGFVSKIFEAPPKPAGADKHYTPPILELVLDHIRDRHLPPTLDPFALLYTKRLIRDANYKPSSFVEASEAEARGAEAVFDSDRVEKQFLRISGGARHKL